MAHTAEHIFVGSLTRLIPSVRVQKVDVSEDESRVYLKAPRLDWDSILKAERMANKVISEGRKVLVHEFLCLEDAKRRFPQLRAHDERIVGKVRVVEVDGYDYSACLGEHVENTRECDFFIVTSISRAGEVFEVRFQVGEKAKEEALELSKLCLRVAEILGATIPTLERTALNLKEECLRLRQRLSSATLEQAMSVKPVEKFGVRLFVRVFDGLEQKKLMDVAGKLVKQEKSVVVFGNKDGPPLVIFARSKDLGIDCASVLQEVLLNFGGKGGGKTEYAFGTIHGDRVEEAVEALRRAVEERLR